MKVLITGGHFSPAYAVLEELKKRGASVAIAGRTHPFEEGDDESYEYTVAKRDNIPFFEVRTGRVQRRFGVASIRSLLKVPVGFLDALSILAAFKPDVVLTFGGYVAAPVAAAAYVRGIPVILHEQTQRAGLAGKAISMIASRVCTSFKSSAKYYPPSKTTLTGNPIRQEVFNIHKKITLPKKDSSKIIYITGGSAGSHTINSWVSPLLDKLLSKYIIIHQAGESLYRDYDKLSAIREKLPERLRKKYILKKFIMPSEIGSVFAAANLVVARAGINTVAEVIALGKAALFIPLTSGQFQEQLENARLARDFGVAEFLEEKEITPESLFDLINTMIRDEKKYHVNPDKLSDLVFERAAEKIVDIVEEVNVKAGS